MAHLNDQEILLALKKPATRDKGFTHAAILRLPEKQRIVFNLRYFDDLSYEEMEEIVGSSVNTLKTNYHYAKEKIKNYLSEN